MILRSRAAHSMRRIVRPRNQSGLCFQTHWLIFYAVHHTALIESIYSGFCSMAALAASAGQVSDCSKAAMIQNLFTNKFLYFKFPRLKKLIFEQILFHEVLKVEISNFWQTTPGKWRVALSDLPK